MKRIKLLVFFVGFIFLNSCSNLNSSDQLDQVFVVHSFQNVYEGKIGELPIVLKLRVDSNIVISGDYFYTNWCNTLKILGGEIKSDTILFREVLEEKPGEVTGNFQGIISQDGRLIKGKWYDRDTSYNLHLEKTSRVYEATYAKICDEKLKTIDLLQQDGVNTLDKGERVFLNVDYSKYNKSLKKISIIVAIGDSGIQQINEKVNEIISKSGKIASGLSVMDKRLKAVEIIAREIDFSTINTVNGAEEYLNIFLLCNKYNDKFEDLHKPSGIYKKELFRDDIPENGFKIYIENSNTSMLSSSQKYEVRVIGQITNKYISGNFKEICSN